MPATALQVVDFGVCLQGSTFHRAINVLNVGNIGCVRARIIVVL